MFGIPIRTTLPMCGKCAARIVEEGPIAERIVGCKDEPLIKGWTDAMSLCPLLKKEKKND